MTPAPAAEADALAELAATACQVMAGRGLVEHVLGHVSVRVSDDEILVRCRGPEEAGFAVDDLGDIRRVGLDGTGDLGEWSAPNELPIQTELIRRRPEVTAVVHAHPSSPRRCSTPHWCRPAALVTSPARLAAGRVPVWDRPALLTTPRARRRDGRHAGEQPSRGAARSPPRERRNG